MDKFIMGDYVTTKPKINPAVDKFYVVTEVNDNMCHIMSGEFRAWVPEDELYPYIITING